jgi:RimJ/RimL family protein N-acetyltransferase
MAAITVKTKSLSKAPTLQGLRDEGTITLSDETVIRYRPIQPADESALQRFHDQLSVERVHLRFMGVVPHLSHQQARAFTHFDGRDRFALVAFDPTNLVEIIAVVRYDRELGTDRVEFAAVVADWWQGRGLGLALTRRLIDAARTRGVRSFYALVLPENIRMLNILRDLGLPEQDRYGDQIGRIEIEFADSSSEAMQAA